MSDPRPDPPALGAERETLVGFLDYLRATVALKTSGLDADQLNRPHPPSTITLAGLLKHLWFVEDYWAGYIVAGEEPIPPWDTAPWEQDDDWDWHSAGDTPPAELHGEWQASVRRADAVLAARPLDHPSARPRGSLGAVSLRWVIMHLIEEYGRHAGHADLVREAIDGQTGE